MLKCRWRGGRGIDSKQIYKLAFVDYPPANIIRMVKKAPVPLKKRPGRTGKKGGQYGNTNPQKHGAFAQIDLRKIDLRTREAKKLAAAKELLIAALGGDPSPQQCLLIDRAIFKALRCSLYEAGHAVVAFVYGYLMYG